MELLVLGCGSAIPKVGRNPTAQLLMFPNAHYLIDCAEGTQLRLLEEKIRPKFLKAIFISHLHGDHYLGLMGLLWSLDLGGRRAPLTLISPTGLSEILKVQLDQANSNFSFEINHNEIEAETTTRIYEDQHLDVRCFPLKHGVPCFGYRFEEKLGRRRFRKDVVTDFNLSPEQIHSALANKPVYDNAGKLVDSELLFMPESEPSSYSYCTDTLAADFVVDDLRDSTVLYHEATYTHDLVDKAESRFHSTAKQAAQVAKTANVGQLVIGHYSSRYDNPAPLLEEAKEVFPNSVAAEDGLRVPIRTTVIQPDSN